MTPDFNYIAITPELAKQLLAGNTKNRIISDERVSLFASDMKSGKWHDESPEAIMISKEGRLLNGQHRLFGVIKAGIPVTLLIATGVKEDVFSFIDQGKVRTTADIFHMEGIKNSSQVSSAIRLFLELSQFGSFSGYCRKVSNDTVLSEYRKRPDFWQQVNSLDTKYYKAMYQSVAPAWIGGWYAYLITILPIETVDTFFDALFLNPKGFTTTESFFDLMVRIKSNPSLKITRVKRDAIFIKTLNSYLQNKPIKILKFTADEPFPAIYKKVSSLTKAA